MSQQWGGGQPGYQYPLQPGFSGGNNQFQQPGFRGGLPPQQAGFQGQRPGFQQPQTPGFPGNQGFQQQPTGFRPGLSGFQQPQQQQPSIQPGPPLLSNINTGFNRPTIPQGGGFLNVNQPQPPQPQLQNRSFLNASPAVGISQPAGFADPRLQLMSGTFLPANPSLPYAGGAPQFASGPPQGDSLQQSFQQYNQQRGPAAPKMPWALSQAEKKQYDQIFRAWDTSGTGFISGQIALEVFGQSGLDKNDLAKIWALADTDNRGKLNLGEFHVAMGLIYRKLNGNDIPDVLPPELIPPSSRDLDTSVNILKDILKHDTSRSASRGDTVSLGKVRSFNDTSPAGAGGRKDATVYKYREDDGDSGSYYQSRSRHVDRRNVRSGNESPGEDLSILKRQLEETQKRLDQATEESASRSAEDEALDREMEDLRYRVKRVQEDLEYVSRGPRNASKDEERRRLERSLLTLLHERIPEVEKKIEERERRREREKRDWARERDRRNETFGRYSDRDRDYNREGDRPAERDRETDRYDRRGDDGRDRGYSRDTYDRDREFDRDRERFNKSRADDRDRYREKERGGDYDRPRSPPRSARSPAPPARSPPRVRSPPPPPPPAASNTLNKPPPAPVPTASPAPVLSKMTPAERSEYIRQQAQRKLRERMEALGVVAPASTPSPAIDIGIETRLAQERKEAEEKAKQADIDAAERDKARREKIEKEKAERAAKAGNRPPVATPTVTSPPPAPAPAIRAPAPSAAPKRAPAPPPPRRGPAPRPPVGSPTVSFPNPRATPAPPAPPAPAPAVPAPVVAKEDPEEKRLREREEQIRKQREARAARLRELEREEEEARRAEEEYEARRQAFTQRSKSTAPPSPPPVAAPAPPMPSLPRTVSSPQVPPPPAPPAPPVPAPPAVSPTVTQPSTNPFSRLINQGAGSAAATPLANGSSNPFFRAQTAPPPAATSPTPTSPAIKTTYNTAPGHSEDEWDDVNEKEDDDSSDDELGSSRDTRNKLAQQLFGNIIPARPQSAASATPTPAFSPAPPPPPAPFAPSAPSTPAAPPPPAFAAPPPSAAPGGRGALLGAIQAGARLRKAVTNDRSAAPVSGKVLGDTAPPPHINTAVSSSLPPPAAFTRSPSISPSLEPEPAPTSRDPSYRQSVDWYAGLAAEQGVVNHMPAMSEEEEEPRTAIPEIQVQAAASEIPDPLADVDKSTVLRVRTLYGYEGQRPEDLSFAENLVISANPSKSGGDWWYGTLVKTGRTGFFPSIYVQVVESVKARSLYSYTSGSADELSFVEGDQLVIVDRSESDWWKTEKEGVIFIVPAAYLEVIEVRNNRPASTNHVSDVDEQTPTNASHGHSSSFASNTSDMSKASDDEDSNDDDYYSVSSSSESDASEHQKTEAELQQEKQARIIERQRVLEAAGLVVKNAPESAQLGRRKSVRGHRPPPSVPRRRRQESIASTASGKDKQLPFTPEPGGELGIDSITHIDDAFYRYESMKNSNDYRLSISSFDTGPPSPGLSVTPSLPPSSPRESRTSHFLHFLSRRTPNPEPDRPRLQISAPIQAGSISPSPSQSSYQENGTVPGTTWASLLGKETLDGIPSNERKRQEAIFELIYTEAAYVRDLQLIVEVFFSSMLDLLDQKEITVIFANIEDLLLTNTAFLSSLEERQKECRLYVDHIGDLLAKHMSNMGAYTQYCVNHGTAIKILHTLREERVSLSGHLQRLREDPAVRNLDLSSYLLAPMQRITRYPLLIRQILNHTQMEDDRKQIGKALKYVEGVLDFINESIREDEGRARLGEITQDLWIDQGRRLDLTQPTRYLGPRRLLKEGQIAKAKSGRKLRAFLCNDILLLTDETAKNLYRTPIPLSEIEVRDTDNDKDETIFRIMLPYPRGGSTIVLRANSVRDCDLWIRAIDNAGQNCRAAEDEARVKARQASQWI